METIALIVFAYLLGSVSSAIIVCRVIGAPDPRSGGSGNPGATNVLRLVGKKAAAVTLAGDMLKGLIPVLIGQVMGMPVEVLGYIGLAAFAGHLYPIFFGFQGGKGVATAFGVMIGVDWRLGLATIGIWLVMAKVFKISSLSALVAMALAPLLAWLLTGSITLAATLALLSIVLFWRHRSNIRDLMSGAEGKIGNS